MSQPVYVMLPCRTGSQRIPGKNTRPFCDLAGGLLELKLRQLSVATNIAGVLVSTDDAKVIEIAEDLRPLFGSALDVIPRPQELAISDSLDAFVAYVPSIMPKGVVFWTHVTSPFFGSREVDLAVDLYRREVELGESDSLMGVTRIQTFMWDDLGCVSHDRLQVKWPQTQDLRPVYEVNSSVFMIDRDDMARKIDRIGEKPFLMKMEKIPAFDVDWPDDFLVAEKIYSLGLTNANRNLMVLDDLPSTASLTREQKPDLCTSKSA